MVFFEDELWVQRSYTTIENPQTLGEHIKKRRQELKILQKDVARILGVTEECISLWETNNPNLHISYYPKIISFLGYNPFPADTSTLAGRVKAYRVVNGLSKEDLAKMVGVNESTVFHWEKGENVPTRKKLFLLENILMSKELLL